MIFMLSYIFNIKRYILPLILFNKSLYHNASRQTLSNAFSKSTKAQSNFLFLLLRHSKKEYRINILPIVELRNPHWLSLNTLNSYENVFSLSFNIDVKSLPRQLNMVIGRKLFGSYLFPLFFEYRFNASN